MKESNIYEILKLSSDFMNLFNDKKKHLPYRINLIDELRANENAHSRIFIKIISFVENERYPFLEMFFKYLGLDFERINVKNPLITAEKNRIDALIQDKQGKYAVIIENKIHGAIDQPEQIEKYINILKKSDFRLEHIYVLYLTKDGGSPSENSLPLNILKEIENRYKEINYKENILPWLEEYILPSCRFKDTLLITAIQQYIDHLNGMFQKRIIEKNMNQELKVHLANELGINSIANSYEKLAILGSEIEKISNINDYLGELQKDIVKEIFSEWQFKIKQKYPLDIVSNAIGENFSKDYLFLGIKLQYQGIYFACAIGMDNFSSKPYYGITIRDCSDSKNTLIEKFVNEVFKNNELDQSPRWYGYRISEFANVYNEFMNICDIVVNKLK
ncbi:MAG: PD-(D/E)XK nuclease family protein [Paludibacter sp.]|nr:PD-(D/E)XK nuclease family protein [Paludibacter sp.]